MGEFQGEAVVLDFSRTKIIDHTFMKEVRTFERDAGEQGVALTLVGLERLVPISEDRAAARRLHAERKCSKGSVALG
jgi:MFS superfamily sulfate permease-like transporter